ncbi:hypothetical protein N781_08680 [Pontibacillus halophilus JSM 076056 = DSM 19796]|uniref:Uncharacterized protein n=1 Tax=Pontibacillus halophilus JSM 076056 = DSM 19796 TaxID=1385510 RepID=A0A0A5GFG8_9BACI|nr:hypothetical protein [Pontibacillus halophilus]KGX89953.1 hypothetical protein N781_08680 [Pontibacillus halophilus JSM 076056 = DSM 19796]
MSNENDRTLNNDQESFEEKKKKERLIDDVPNTDLKIELEEQEDGSHEKDDSLSEEEYKEDYHHEHKDKV